MKDLPEISDGKISTIPCPSSWPPRLKLFFKVFDQDFSNEKHLKRKTVMVELGESQL